MISVMTECATRKDDNGGRSRGERVSLIQVSRNPMGEAEAISGEQIF